MSRPYKAKQSKALHKGWHVSYGVADGDVWTTNSYVCVRYKVTPEEMRTLKDQQDKRGETALDLESLLAAFAVHTTELAEYKPSKSILKSDTLSAVIDKDIYEYVEALFPSCEWGLTKGRERTMIVAAVNDEIMAMVAPIEEEK